MLFNLLGPLADEFIVFNLFNSLTFRAGGAVVTALLVSFLFGPMIIGWLRQQQPGGQPIREDGPRVTSRRPEHHMGGFLILLAIIVSTLLWADLRNGYVWAVLLITVGFGAIGFVDDYHKLTRSHAKGISGKVRLLAEIIVAGVATFWIIQLAPDPISTSLALPFVKNFLIELSWFFVPFAIFVIVRASNSVNLTDGLDGLAIVPVMIAASCFGLISYVAGNAVFSNYLLIFAVPGSGELAIFCGALIGAGLGFLWFNAPPAMVFMGDTGSLAMGGALGRNCRRDETRTGSRHHRRAVCPWRLFQ